MQRKIHKWTLFMLVAVQASSAVAAQPVMVSVCEINAHPGKFEGMNVSVRGRIYAGMETTNISDPSCPGSGIQLVVTEGASKHNDIDAFERGIRQHGMHAMATVVGHFYANAPVYPFPMPAIYVNAIKHLIFYAK